jgi:hypothetical protein
MLIISMKERYKSHTLMNFHLLKKWFIMCICYCGGGAAAKNSSMSCLAERTGKECMYIYTCQNPGLHLS